MINEIIKNKIIPLIPTAEGIGRNNSFFWCNKKNGQFYKSFLLLVIREDILQNLGHPKSYHCNEDDIKNIYSLKSYSVNTHLVD